MLGLHIMNVADVWPCVSYVSILGKQTHLGMKRNGRNLASMVTGYVDAQNAKHRLKRMEAAIT